MSAIAALKGYRTQFLYSLHRIITDSVSDYTYHIEGQYEDIDILSSGGKYAECLQVKNLSTTLTFSDLFSAQDSFFRRIVKVSSANPNMKSKIISFSSVSDELNDNSKLRTKLRSKKFTDNDIQTILAHYTTPVLVSEESLYSDIVDNLKRDHPFVDPQIAVELLLSWIYYSAEKQISITKTSLIQAIQRVGLFVQERVKFQSQYGSTILPLQIKSIDDNISVLKEGYFAGVSAKYEHILAGLDIIRHGKLSDIDKAFATNNIVFVHGASGQGKSSLAYRFLSDNCVDGTVYELKLSSSFNDVRDTINCLDGLCKGLNIPVVIYMDVLPDNNYWNEVIKELACKSNLKFLITLRQETWNKTILGEDYNFKDIELIFDKEEAESIYSSIFNNNGELVYANFEESWVQFGGNGLLLEYMYFLNHGEKLKIKLQSQIRQFEDKSNVEELKVLRYVCLADRFNAKVEIGKLLNKAGISLELARLRIGNLEKEYLVKFSDDSSYLTGMHYVRSKILCEILFDENGYINKTDYIDDLIQIIDESDIHYFLLNSFENNYNVDKLLSTIRSNDLSFSWIGVTGILKALLWKGVYDFIFTNNFLLFEELFKELHRAWWVGLPYDYSGTMDGGLSGSMREIFKEHNPNLLCFIDDISLKFTPKDDVYKYARQWLFDFGERDTNIGAVNDIPALGIYCFWLGHLSEVSCKLNLNHSRIIEIINSNDISIDNLAELILGLYSVSTSSDTMETLRTIAINKLRAKYTILTLNIGEEIDCLYAYNLMRFDTNSKELGNSSNTLNDTSVRIIDLLRKIYPHCTKYNARCVGMDCFNQYIPMQSDYDPSHKHISRENLPINHLVQINQLMINLFDYSKRLDTWEMYTQRVLELRSSYNRLMELLINNFAEYFKTSDVRKFIPVCNELVEVVKQDTQIDLPKIISDKWGYEKECIKYESKETNKPETDIKGTKNQPSISFKYVEYLKSQSEYFNALYRLFSQLSSNIIDTVKTQRGDQVDNYNSNLSYLHLNDALLEGSKFTTEISDKFAKYYDSNEIENLANNERLNLLVILDCWRAFANNKPMTQKLKKVAVDKFNKTKKDLSSKISNAFAQIRSRTKKLKFEIFDKKLILAYEINEENIGESIAVSYSALREILSSDYFSMKRLIIKSNFEDLIFIPLICGNPINKVCWRFPLYSIADKERTDEDILKTVDYTYQEDQKILNQLDLQTWESITPAIRDYQQIEITLSSLIIYSTQINELSNFTDKEGERLLNEYKKDCLEKLNEDFAMMKQDISMLDNLLDDDICTDISDVIMHDDILEQEVKAKAIVEVLAANKYKFVRAFVNEKHR